MAEYCHKSCSSLRLCPHTCAKTSTPLVNCILDAMLSQRYAKHAVNAASVGATENAGVENAIQSKLQGWKMQEWKMREQIAGVENAGVSRMERQPKIILRQP